MEGPVQVRIAGGGPQTREEIERALRELAELSRQLDAACAKARARWGL